MATLTQLNQELSFPSAAKLFIAARKRGLDVSKEEAKEVASKGVREAFRAAPKQEGKIAARDNNSKVQADLIDFKQLSSKDNNGYKYVLIAIEVLSRKIYTKALKTKTPKEVLSAWESLNLGPIERLDVDGGAEWKDVEAKLKANNVGFTVRDPNNINALGVVDSSIGSWKTALARKMASEASETWYDKVASVTAARNATPHEALRGDEPNEVKTNKIVEFHALQDNARKIDKNQAVIANLKDRLEATGSFRALLPRSAWTRAFTPKYSSEVLKVESIQGTSVKATNGKTYTLNKVTPVNAASTDLKMPRALQAGSAARDEKIRAAVQPFEARIKGFLGGETKTLTQVSKHMKTIEGWQEALAQLRLNRPGGFAKAAQSLDAFTFSGSNQQSSMRVKAPRVKKRLLGKQSAPA
jgi:hypothetical protein